MYILCILFCRVCVLGVRAAIFVCSDDLFDTVQVMCSQPVNLLTLISWAS